MVDGDARSLSQDAQEALRVRGVKLLLEGVTQREVAELLVLVSVGASLAEALSTGWLEGAGEAQARPGCGVADGALFLPAVDACRVDQELPSRSAADPGAVVDALGGVRADRDECGVRLDLSTVGRYLRRWGFTLKRPVKRALEADPVVVEAWLEEVYPQICARARRERGLILWQDESGVRLVQLVPRPGMRRAGSGRWRACRASGSART